MDASHYIYPNHSMIKFRGKNSNIDDAYNYFKMIMNAREWNVKNLLLIK